MIGNSAYAGKPIPGALVDAKGMADLLASKVSWELDKDHLTRADNLRGDALEKAVRSFFTDKARPGETLLFYYAGHGGNDGGEAYLEPIEEPSGKPGKRLTASALWGWIQDSKASQKLVILDACRSGGFRMPDWIERKAKDKKALFLMSTTDDPSSGAAADTAQGGPFTQALIEALRSPDWIDPRIGGVTPQLAQAHASSTAAAQHPRLAGAPEIDDLALSWPPLPNLKTETTTGAPSGRPQGTLLASVTARGVTSTSRQSSARAKGVVERVNEREQRRIDVDVVFGDATESLRVELYPDNAMKSPSVFLIWTNPKGGGWAKGTRTTIPVYLDDGFRPGWYRGEVEPCGAAGECGKEPVSPIKVEVK